MGWTLHAPGGKRGTYAKDLLLYFRLNEKSISGSFQNVNGCILIGPISST